MAQPIAHRIACRPRSANSVSSAAVLLLLAAVGAGGVITAGAAVAKPTGPEAISPPRGEGAAAAEVAESPRDVSVALGEIATKYKVPALAVLKVNARGDVLVQGVTGVRANVKDPAAQIPATMTDVWHLGSCSKAMTGTLCAILVRQGTLKWTSTLGEVLGGTTGATLPAVAGLPEAVMDAQWRAVTLEQLLVHRGGAPADLDAGGLWGKLWQHRGGATESRQLLATGLLATPPKHTPGTTFEYSNAGIALAGLMAETAAATPFEVLIERELFAPLGITTAGFGAPGTISDPAADPADANPDQPRGHNAKMQPQPPGPKADNPQAITPAGRVHMSIADWGKFASLHLRGEREGWKNPDGTWRLKAEDFTKLHLPQRDAGAADGANAYAMGWALIDGKGTATPLLQHAGSNTMWLCQIVLDRDGDAACLVCCNAAGAGADRAVRAATTLLRK